VCGVVWCYVGGEEDAAKAMAPLLERLPEPLLHGVQSMPHSAILISSLAATRRSRTAPVTR